ncbi:uncharacterized protein J3D65DRAFT_443545 [Phyllosticta citribraziliensis]|uniref:Uncharacterized protein n=1 Tax=Phyllosticta citribraziliensis TaxID=989973 RepID=A0ABR1LML0_9PEZI
MAVAAPELTANSGQQFFSAKISGQKTKSGKRALTENLERDWSRSCSGRWAVSAAGVEEKRHRVCGASTLEARVACLWMPQRRPAAALRLPKRRHGGAALVGARGARIWAPPPVKRRLSCSCIRSRIAGCQQRSPHRYIVVFSQFKSHGDLDLSAARCPLPARDQTCRGAVLLLTAVDVGQSRARQRSIWSKRTFTINAPRRPSRKLVVQ